MGRRSKFHLHAVALSDHRSTAKVFATHDGFGSSILGRGQVPEVTERVHVPLYALDEFVRERMPEPDVMKLDVQVTERLILTGECRSLQSAKIYSWERESRAAPGPTRHCLRR